MEEGNQLQRLVDGIEQIFLECSGEQKPPEEIIHRLEQIKLQWKETCEPHEIGRPEYLITEYMHVNRIMQNDIFLRYAVEAYSSCFELEMWHAVCVVCERVLEMFFHMGSLSDVGLRDSEQWFRHWSDAAERWMVLAQPEGEYWSEMGTAFLSRCEWISEIGTLESHVFPFWYQLVQSFGSFTPTVEYQRQFAEFLQQTTAELARNPDYRSTARQNFIKKRNLLKVLAVPDELLDLINRYIAELPAPLSKDEIEVQINQIQNEQRFHEACHQAESLATRLRIDGHRLAAISLMREVLNREDAEVESIISNTLRMKLGIYLDEEDAALDEILPLFEHVLGQPTSDDLLQLKQQYDAATRVASFLFKHGEVQRALEYSKKAVELAQIRDDKYDLVKSAWNYAGDLHEAEQEGFLEFYELGIAHLHDALTTGVVLPNPNQMGMLMKFFQGISKKLQQEDRYEEVIEELQVKVSERSE